MYPFASIIIPVYNAEKTIRRCLNSVINQTYPEWEAICINDGSTDESRKILDEFASKEKRIKVVHCENKGVSSARNRGIRLATGEFIWFIDADDEIKSISLELFSSMGWLPDVTICGVDEVFDDGYVRQFRLSNRKFLDLDEASSKTLHLLFRNDAHMNMFGYPWNKFIRRSVVVDNSLKFDEGVSFFEDELFSIQLFNVTRTVAVLSDVLYEYHVSNSGLTGVGYSSKPQRLASRYYNSYSRSKYGSLKSIAIQQAYRFARKELASYKDYATARLLLYIWRSDGLEKPSQGFFPKILRFASKFPLAIGTLILTMYAKARKG